MAVGTKRWQTKAEAAGRTGPPRFLLIFIPLVVAAAGLLYWQRRRDEREEDRKSREFIERYDAEVERGMTDDEKAERHRQLDEWRREDEARAANR